MMKVRGRLTLPTDDVDMVEETLKLKKGLMPMH